jgi:hypothetical protein
MFRRITALAAGIVLLASAAVAATWPAAATTGTCTNIASPISLPIGCGGVFLPKLGGGIQPNTSSLTLTAAADNWNAPITLTPYNPADATQDFTVYQVCDFTAAPFNAPTAPTAALPCGTNGHPVLDPVSGFGEYVAEVTPLGQHLGGAINAIGNLCLSVEAVHDGPWHHLRWHVVERTCNTYGAHFTEGIPSSPVSLHGVAGVVNLANHFQTWSPIPASGGYVLANNALSGNFFNHPFVLDARGGHGPSVLAFPENDQANEIWKVIGCTNPVTSLTPGFFSCP